MKGSFRVIALVGFVGLAISFVVSGGEREPVQRERKLISSPVLASVGLGKMWISFATGSAADRDPEVEGVRLQVFNLRGRLIYDSGFRPRWTVQWNLQTQSGAVAANGVYLFVITARDREGRLLSRVGKIVVLR